MGNDVPSHARRYSAVSSAKMAEPIDLPFGLWTRVSRRKHKFNCICHVVPTCPRRRANCGGVAALCQNLLVLMISGVLCNDAMIISFCET